MTDPRVTDAAVEAATVAYDDEVMRDGDGAAYQNYSTEDRIYAALTAALPHLVADTIAKARREGEADMRERCAEVASWLAGEGAAMLADYIRAIYLSGDEPQEVANGK